jgi:DNA-binding transcriptional MerR regulator
VTSGRRRYLRIGEVSAETGVPPHVLRYWESEFPQLQPHKGRGGQRRYSHADIETIRRIRGLLWDRKFTVAGAREALDAPTAALPNDAAIDEWITELRVIRDTLRAAAED